MLPVHNSGYQLYHPLPHSPDPRPRYPLQHIQNLHPFEHHIFLGYENRETPKLILRQVPRVLRLRRQVLEENRYTTSEDRVERRPPRRSVTGRLQAETRPQHWPHEPDRIMLANPIGAINNITELLITVSRIPSSIAVALDPYTPANVRRGGDTSTAGEESKRVALGSSNALNP